MRIPAKLVSPVHIFPSLENPHMTIRLFGTWLRSVVSKFVVVPQNISNKQMYIYRIRVCLCIMYEKATKENKKKKIKEVT